MTTRDKLVRAFEQNDHDAVKALGWWPVWDALHTGWAPKQTASANDLVSYSRFLGNEKPDEILEAIEACAGPWRPVPADLRHHLNAKRANSNDRVDIGGSRDPASTPAAMAATRDALAAGETDCTCNRAPTSIRWRVSPEGVLRCPYCRGLEAGQAYYANEPEDGAEIPFQNPLKVKGLGEAA